MGDFCNIAWYFEGGMGTGVVIEKENMEITSLDDFAIDLVSPQRVKARVPYSGIVDFSTVDTPQPQQKKNPFLK